MRSKRIFLCGFMGVGKTTIGKTFSKKIGLNFLDLDELIEEKAQKSVRSIFEDEGESYFRNLEFECLKDNISNGEVIALGGGTLMNQSCVDLVLSNGKLIYLHCEINKLSTDLPERPLIKSKGLSELYEERIIGYKNAQYTLNIDELEELVLYDRLTQIWSS